MENLKSIITQVGAYADLALTYAKLIVAWAITQGTVLVNSVKEAFGSLDARAITILVLVIGVVWLFTRVNAGRRQRRKFKARMAEKDVLIASLSKEKSNLAAKLEEQEEEHATVTANFKKLEEDLIRLKATAEVGGTDLSPLSNAIGALRKEVTEIPLEKALGILQTAFEQEIKTLLEDPRTRHPVLVWLADRHAELEEWGVIGFERFARHPRFYGKKGLDIWAAFLKEKEAAAEAPVPAQSQSSPHLARVS